MYKVYPKKRYEQTLSFLENHISKTETILDLGVKNPLSELMIQKGFEVTNTSGEDLDNNFQIAGQSPCKVLTAFEILEHLVCPYNVLKYSNAKKLIATVPLKLWFSLAYQSKTDKRDRHFHEFENWQFDWLLEKAGWKIIAKKQWTNPVKKIGFRPLLRYWTPRYYAVYAER